MKGKLHKMVSGYILSLNGDIDDPYAIVNKELAEDYEWYKLSLKNCQAIERGYDLDELAYSCFPNGTYETSEIDLGLDMYKKGFQKAFELLGDNVFDWLEKKGYLSDDKDIIKEEYNHQTEWDVEIEMVPALSNNGNVYYGEIPKLDENECLILKRI